MADLDDVLHEKTHKDEGLDLAVRVFYTLSGERGPETHRDTKAIAVLIRLLHKKGYLADKDVDDLLLECIDARAASG